MEYQAKMIFLGTGITDNIPPIKNIYTTLGTSTYICPDCDGYEIMDKQTVVLGGGNAGAGMALTLLYWSKDIIYVNHLKSKIDEKYRKKLKANQIPVFEEEVEEVLVDAKQQLTAIQLVSGKIIEAEKAFTAFKGNKLNNGLALQLGVHVNENNHVVIHPALKKRILKEFGPAVTLLPIPNKSLFRWGMGPKPRFGFIRDCWASHFLMINTYGN